MSDCREKEDLFERREDTLLILQKHVFAWLCGSDVKLPGGCRVYPVPEETAAIRTEVTERVSSIAKRQLTDAPQERLVFEIQGRPGAGKKYFCRACAARLGYRICRLCLSDVIAAGRREGRELLCKCYFACRVNGCIPYLDLTDCDTEDAGTRQWIESVVSEYKLIFIGTTMDQTLARAMSFSAQKMPLDQLDAADRLALWQAAGSAYPVAENVNYEQLAGNYRLLPVDICEVFARAEQYRIQGGQEQIDRELILACVRECNQLSGNVLMEQIHTVFRWEDLKVKPEIVKAMHLACAP